MFQGLACTLDGKALKSQRGSGFGSNYYDLETGDSYWISGVKKNNQDRHWAGNGNILIDRIAVAEWLKFTGLRALPDNLVETELKSSEQMPHHREIEHRKLEHWGEP